MPPEIGRQELTLFLSIAGCELFRAFNGLQLAQVEEANYKTLREISEGPSTLEQKCNLGREDEVLPPFPEMRKDKEEQQNEGKMVICCKVSKFCPLWLHKATEPQHYLNNSAETEETSFGADINFK